MCPDRPFCFNCGYDLRGLELPHPCPECGLIADLPLQVEHARQWFKSRKAWFWWLRRPSKLPVGWLYVLHDPASVRVARRRTFLCIYLPVILACLLTLFLATLVFEIDTKTWFYKRSDPKQTPVDIRQKRDFVRLYPNSIPSDTGLNLSTGSLILGILESAYSKTWAKGKEITVARVHFQPPTFEPSLIKDIVASLLFLVCNYYPCLFIIWVFSKKAAVRLEHAELTCSIKSANSMAIVLMGIMMWCMFFSVVIDHASSLAFIGVITYRQVLQMARYYSDLLLVVPWLFVFFIGWPLFLHNDRGRVIFSHPWWIGLLLAGSCLLSIGLVLSIILWI